MILNKTTFPGERHRVIPGSQGNYGDPLDSPNHAYVVVSGVDRGRGYQSYTAVSYFLENGNFPKEAKRNLIKFLSEHGYDKWLKKHGHISGAK